MCTLWPTRAQAMRDSTLVKLRAFLNLKGAHKGDGSKESKYRNKTTKEKTRQSDRQPSEREEEEEKTDQNLPVIIAPKLSSFAQLKKQTNIQNAPSVPKERRDSREIVAAEQLMNRTKEEGCCRDGRIYHNLVLLSSWWSAATHDLPCKRASQDARSPECRGDSYLPS